MHIQCFKDVGFGSTKLNLKLLTFADRHIMMIISNGSSSQSLDQTKADNNNAMLVTETFETVNVKVNTAL